MALKIKVKDVEFGIGDKIRVVQRIKDGDKFREAAFDGMVLAIRGREPGKTFIIRKIAEGGIGVERIFPINLPTISKIVILKKGVEGVKRAKLYYTRTKSATEIEMIFKKAAIRGSVKNVIRHKSSPKKAKSKK